MNEPTAPPSVDPVSDWFWWLATVVVATGAAWLAWSGADPLEGGVPEGKLALLRMGAWALAMGAGALALCWRPALRLGGVLLDLVAERGGEPLPRRAGTTRLERRAIGVFLVFLLVVPAVVLTTSDRGYAWVVSEYSPAQHLTTVLYLVAAAWNFRTAFRWRGRRLLALNLALLGFLCFFVGMEEISWGQTYFPYATPDAVRSLNVQGEITVHNLYSNTLGQFVALLTVASMLLFAPLVSMVSPRVARALDSLGYPTPAPRYAGLFGLVMAAYFTVGAWIGTFGIGRYIARSGLERHTDDEVFEFLVCLLLLTLSLSRWGLSQPDAATEEAHSAELSGVLVDASATSP